MVRSRVVSCAFALALVSSMAVAASTATAKTQLGWTHRAVTPPLLDTITVDEQGVDPVLGTYSLVQGVEYSVQISGTSVFSNGENLDAIYCLGGGGSTGCPARIADSMYFSVNGMQFFYAVDAFQEQGNSPDPNCRASDCPEGLAYQSSHVYTMNFWAPVTGVLKVTDFAAALGYPAGKSPESGTYTVSIYGIPATVELPKDIRSPDSPKGMKDRFPPRVDTMIAVTVTGVSPSMPVTLESVGTGPTVTFNGSPTYEISSDGTYYPMLSANSQTPCGAGPDDRIEALQNNQILAKSRPFAVSSIPYNYTDAFHSLIGGRARGFVVQDGWRSDSERLSDLDCVDLAEVVQVTEGDGKPPRTSSYLSGDSFTTDSHSFPVADIYPNQERIVDQATAFIDKRSGSGDVSMQNSGYEIVRTANATGLEFTTCKVGKAVTVSELKGQTNRTITASSAAGATTPKKGICRTQAVPDAEPAFTSGSDTTCTVGEPCSFQIVMDGRPQPKLTVSGKQPKGLRVVTDDNDTAMIEGTPAKGSQGRYHLILTAKNGVGRSVSQEFTIFVNQ